MSTANDRYDSADGPRDRSLRVGDSEREAVGEILRQRHLEGRLDTDELQSRLERCLTAKRYAELDELVADFPSQAVERRRARRSWSGGPWPLPFVLLPIAVIAAIVVGHRAAWIAVPLFFFVVRPLLWHARGGGFGRGPWSSGPRRTTRV